jgi:osmotically-inducible protein OsmY
MQVATKNKTDSQIKQDVLRELKWDTRVSETEVGIEVDDHVVSLTGSVPTYMKKLAAEQAAHRVFGVQDVANDIEVLLPGHKFTDTEIAKRLRSALDWQLLLPDETVTSTIKDGWVTLNGTVDSFSHREDAIKAVRYIKGVRGVKNDISIRPFYSATAAEVRDEIEDALDRQAVREVNHVTVKVEDGVVRLEGTVRSWPERRAVVDAAQFTPGVRSVESHLHVDPYAAL